MLHKFHQVTIDLTSLRDDLRGGDWESESSSFAKVVDELIDDSITPTLDAFKIYHATAEVEELFHFTRQQMSQMTVDGEFSRKQLTLMEHRADGIFISILAALTTVIASRTLPAIQAERASSQLAHRMKGALVRVEMNLSDIQEEDTRACSQWRAEEGVTPAELIMARSAELDNFADFLMLIKE